MVTAAPTITLFRMAMVLPLKRNAKGETKVQSPKAPTIQLPTVIGCISRARQSEYAAMRGPTTTSSQRAAWIRSYERANGAMTNQTPSATFAQLRAFINVTSFSPTMGEVPPQRISLKQRVVNVEEKDDPFCKVITHPRLSWG